MANLNKVHLIGNLTRDPELRYTPKGTAVAEISIAINRTWSNEQNQKQEETTFVEITFFGKTAGLAQKFLAKGNPVFVEGRLHLETWDDKQTGAKRSKMKVIGENMQFLGGNKSDGGQRGESRPSQSQKPQPAPASDDYHDEDDIPF